MTSSRRPAGAVTCAVLALLFLAAGGPASSGSSDVRRLPPGTATRIGAPPFEPSSRDDGDIARWIEEAEALAQAEGVTVHAADLWLSSAALLEQRPAGHARAVLAYLRARDLYPAGAPRQGWAAARVVTLHVDAGNAPEAEKAFAWLAGWQGHPPRGVDATVATADVALLERLQAERVVLQSRLARMFGRFGEAALLLEGLAADPTRDADDTRRAGWWMQAARAWVRARDHEAADRAARAAMSLVDAPQQKAQLDLWRLHARFDALDDHGDPAPPVPWPGDAFEDAARDHLATWSRTPEGACHALALASSALQAGAPDAAARLYAVALDNPVLLARATVDPDVFEGLLVPIALALREGELDDAERRIVQLETLRSEPHATLDALRIQLAERRASRDDERRAPRPAPPPLLRPRIDVAPSPREERAPSAPSAGETPASPTSRGTGWLLAGLGLAIVLVTATRRRAARRRLRAPRPRRRAS